MTTRRQAFRQVDVTRAIKGALAAGVGIASCQLRPDGTIDIKVSGASDDPAGGPNDFDVVLRS